MNFKYLLKSVFVVMFFMIFSCEDDYVPKPNAFLRLEYPEAKYKKQDFDLPFSLETNEIANRISTDTIDASTDSYAINIDYPSLKGTIYLTYKAIGADKNKLIDFLRDAQKFTLEHTIKADEIPKYPYENKEAKVYGMLSEVRGNAASPAQFYVTDSINHFLTGSVYFNAAPNYDSILPAAKYLQKDLRHMIETIHWK